MSMTNQTMSPKVAPNPLLDKLKEEEQVFANSAADFKSELAAEAISKEQTKEQLNFKNISELTEADAYDLNVPIRAGREYNPNALKVVLKDPNYIARWCNRNNVRQAQLVAMGFMTLHVDEVANIDTLDMFKDTHGHLIYSDLVAMKIQKDVYYAGLRRAHQKSLHATNNHRAAQAGAQFATNNLESNLGAAERGYMQRYADQHANKPVYNPNVGV